MVRPVEYEVYLMWAGQEGRRSVVMRYPHPTDDSDRSRLRRIAGRQRVRWQMRRFISRDPDMHNFVSPLVRTAPQVIVEWEL